MAPTRSFLRTFSLHSTRPSSPSKSSSLSNDKYDPGSHGDHNSQQDDHDYNPQERGRRGTHSQTCRFPPASIPPVAYCAEAAGSAHG